MHLRICCWYFSARSLCIQSCTKSINWHSCHHLCQTGIYKQCISFEIIHEWPHPGNTAFPYQEKQSRKAAWFIVCLLLKGHHKQLEKMRTRWITAMARALSKHFATGVLNKILQCTNLKLTHTGSHMNAKHKLSSPGKYKLQSTHQPRKHWKI